ncbi:MAG: hypothetical protein JSV00_06605 [bacterium]|nr:MAG: hypothetical protein JSV00_06605 [bacterium]
MKRMLIYRILKKRLGYNDREMEKFRADERNERVVSKIPSLMKKRLVLEVVASHGCNSQHQVGDRFVFDAFGNLDTRQCPDQVCVFLLGGAQNLLYAGMELFLADADPNRMTFKRTHCADVGLECGGWGKVVVELKAEEES